MTRERVQQMLKDPDPNLDPDVALIVALDQIRAAAHAALMIQDEVVCYAAMQEVEGYFIDTVKNAMDGCMDHRENAAAMADDTFARPDPSSRKHPDAP